MKTLTVNRGAALACACSLLCSLAVLLTAGLVVPADAAAAGSSDKGISRFESKPLHLGTGTHQTSASGAGGSIVRTLIGLLIVVIVIYGLYWIMKQAKSSKSSASGEGLEQIASLPLGTGRSVALVRVGGELHMLGVAEHGISPLRIFTEEEAYELGLPMESDTPVTTGDGLPPIQRLVGSLRRFSSR